MSSTVNLKFRKKQYDINSDNTDGVVVFNTTEHNLYAGGEKYGETRLMGLTDVVLSNDIENNQVLAYSSIDGKWKNKSIGGVSSNQIYMGNEQPSDQDILIWIDTSGSTPSEYIPFITSSNETFITSDDKQFTVIP